MNLTKPSNQVEAIAKYNLTLPDAYYGINELEILAASVWLVFVFFGLIGNTIVIFTIIKYNKLSNVTQHYLLNLAITDICFLIFCVPLTSMSYLIDGWKFGRIACKLYHYLSFVTVCSNCLTLMSLTLGECLVKPSIILFRL